MESFLNSAILAFVQGITEFIPVSSSAHLLFFRKFLNICNDHSFDVFLNLGTLSAILCFFWYDTRNLIAGGLDFLFFKQSENKSFFYDILIANIPTFLIFGIVEFFYGKQTESILVLVISLILFSFVIYYCDTKFDAKKSHYPSRKEWFFIGIAQVLAIVPGVSRLGVTTAAFRCVKYDRISSFKYSLILSVPAVAGACFLKCIKLIKYQSYSCDLAQMLICLLISFVVGIATLRIVISFLRTHTYFAFIVYRVIFGLLILFFMF